MNGTAVWSILYIFLIEHRVPASPPFFLYPSPQSFSSTNYATAGKCFFSGVQYMINPSVSSVSKWEIVTTCTTSQNTTHDYVPPWLRFSTFPTAVLNISFSIFIWLFQLVLSRFPQKFTKSCFKESLMWIWFILRIYDFFFTDFIYMIYVIMDEFVHLWSALFKIYRVDFPEISRVVLSKPISVDMWCWSIHELRL